MSLVIIIAAGIYIGGASPRYIFPREEPKPTQTLTFMPVPWLGVLVYKPGGNSTNFATGVILIQEKIAISHAQGIAKLEALGWNDVRNKTNVMFMTLERDEWYAKVKEASIHPEFNEETLSTIAVLYLEYNTRQYQGKLLAWPSSMKMAIPYTSNKLFAIAYTDRSSELEQIVYRMDFINTSSCIQFYISEELDSRWHRPMKYHCYRVRYAKDTCVFDPGFALVYYDKEKWTLLGMSTWGPGCALPARFLDFDYFLPWIAEQVSTRRKSETQSVITPAGPSKSRVNIEWWLPDPGPPTPDFDTWLLSQTSNTSYVLRPLTNKPDIETLLNFCGDANQRKPEMLIYRDRSVLNITEEDVEVTGVYGVSLYDLKYHKQNYTCIEINAVCENKSDSMLRYTKTFKQDHDFIEYTRDQPIEPDAYYPRRPYMYHLTETWLKYRYDIIGSDVTHLMFKFSFHQTAYFDILFYGNMTQPETTSTTPKMTTMNNMTGVTTGITTTPAHMKYTTGIEHNDTRPRSRRPYTTSTRRPNLKPVPHSPRPWHPYRNYTPEPEPESEPEFSKWWQQWWNKPQLRPNWWKNMG